jgi:hypothetical protein
VWLSVPGEPVDRAAWPKKTVVRVGDASEVHVCRQGDVRNRVVVDAGCAVVDAGEEVPVDGARRLDQAVYQLGQLVGEEAGEADGNFFLRGGRLLNGCSAWSARSASVISS